MIHESLTAMWYKGALKLHIGEQMNKILQEIVFMMR